MPGLRATILRLYTLVSTMAAFAVPSRADDLQVLGVEPPAHSLNVPVDWAIVVHFDKPVRRESLVSGITFWAFGRWSGTCTGTFEFSDDDQTVTLVPNRSFSAGESVMVILSHDIEATDGTALRDAGYSFQFWTESGKSGLGFVPAYNLGNFLRRLALPTSVKHWSLTTLRQKLFKIRAKIVRHSKYVTFQRAEVAVPRDLFVAILDRIQRFGVPPPWVQRG